MVYSIVEINVKINYTKRNINARQRDENLIGIWNLYLTYLNNIKDFKNILTKSKLMKYLINMFQTLLF